MSEKVIWAVAPKSMSSRPLVTQVRCVSICTEPPANCPDVSGTLTVCWRLWRPESQPPVWIRMVATGVPSESEKATLPVVSESCTRGDMAERLTSMWGL